MQLLCTSPTQTSFSRPMIKHLHVWGIVVEPLIGLEKIRCIAHFAWGPIKGLAPVVLHHKNTYNPRGTTMFEIGILLEEEGMRLGRRFPIGLVQMSFVLRGVVLKNNLSCSGIDYSFMKEIETNYFRKASENY